MGLCAIDSTGIVIYGIFATFYEKGSRRQSYCSLMVWMTSDNYLASTDRSGVLVCSSEIISASFITVSDDFGA